MAIAPTNETRDALLALLDWYVESGVDIALDPAPHDRYAETAGLPAPPADAAPQVAPTAGPPPMAARRAPQGIGSAATGPGVRTPAIIAAPDEAARAAEAAAGAARDLADLAARLAEFPHAPFREMARHFVFAAGTPGAALMALDAAPGAAEESSGEPFSGDRARLLDAILAAIGRNRDSAYLAYVAPWRPPGDKTLSEQERAIFAPFARRHVELAQPKVVLLFGEAPARAMIAGKEPVSQMRGRPFDLAPGVRGFVFSGLDNMLKSPPLKRAAWRDLRAAAALLSA